MTQDQGNKRAQAGTMKTWAVTWHEDGAAYTEGYLTEADARTMAADFASIDPDVSAWDMLPPLAARFPVGSRVRNTDGTLGTVAEQGPDGIMNEVPAAHAIMWRAEEAVSVLWDGSRFPSWTVATYVEAAPSLAAASEQVPA